MNQTDFHNLLALSKAQVKFNRAVLKRIKLQRKEDLRRANVDQQLLELNSSTHQWYEN